MTGMMPDDPGARYAETVFTEGVSRKLIDAFRVLDGPHFRTLGPRASAQADADRSGSLLTIAYFLSVDEFAKLFVGKSNEINRLGFATKPASCWWTLASSAI